MSAQRDLPGSKLEWRQTTAWSREFELLDREGRRGSLNFLKTFGTLAEGQIDGSAYSFKRIGFLRPQITIWKKPHQEDIGRVTMGLGSRGALELADGGRYSFQRQSFWKNVWAFVNERGDAVLTMHMDFALVHRSGQVEIGPSGSNDPHLPMLMLLGWYMAVLIEEENAAAGAVAASG